MAQCLTCGRKGFFLRVNNAGLCKDCAAEAEQRAAAEREAGLSEARAFVSGISAAFADILKSGAHFPLGVSGSFVDTKDVPGDAVRRLCEECSFICSELPRWEEYPYFEVALLEECNPHPRITGCYEHPFMNFGLLHEIGGPMSNDFSHKISDLLKSVRALKSALILCGEYEYVTCRIVGVTFKNDDGGDRQEILKKIRYRAAPYRSDPDIHLVKYDYKGEEAVAVYANDEQIGSISRLDLSMKILPRWDRYKDIDEFSVHGTGERDNKFGMDIRVRFRK